MFLQNVIKNEIYFKLSGQASSRQHKVCLNVWWLIQIEQSRIPNQNLLESQNDSGLIIFNISALQFLLKSSYK